MRDVLALRRIEMVSLVSRVIWIMRRAFTLAPFDQERICSLRP
jgi:hypothetical protein